MNSRYEFTPTQSCLCLMSIMLWTILGVSHSGLLLYVSIFLWLVWTLFGWYLCYTYTTVHYILYRDLNYLLCILNMILLIYIHCISAWNLVHVCQCFFTCFYFWNIIHLSTIYKIYTLIMHNIMLHIVSYIYILILS